MIGIAGIQKVIDQGLQDRNRFLEVVPATIIRFENGAWHVVREIEQMGVGFVHLRDTDLLVFSPRAEVERIIHQLRPPSRAAPEIQAIREEAERETQEKFPLSDPALQAEAKRAGVTPAEMQRTLAHEIFLEKRRKLLERFEQEEFAKRPPLEQREEELQ